MEQEFMCKIEGRTGQDVSDLKQTNSCNTNPYNTTTSEEDDNATCETEFIDGFSKPSTDTSKSYATGKRRGLS